VTVTTPPKRAGRDVVLVWAALTAITVAAWQLTPGHSQRSTATGDELVAVIVLLGAVKCRLIVRHFMEVRTAPRWLRTTTDAWLVVLWTTLLAIYLVTTG
jgi:hypothetical protein